jgi:hypothetical protein
MKLLKDLEEDVEVAEVSEVGEMVGEDQLGVIIVMSRDISLEIVLFQRRPWCAHCRNNTHATEDFPELIVKWEDRARK